MEYSCTNLTAVARAAMMQLFLDSADVICYVLCNLFNIVPTILLMVVADGVVDILRAGQRRIRDSTPGREKKISLLLMVRISSETYAVFYLMGTGNKSAAV